MAAVLQVWLLLQACQCGSSREAPAAAKSRSATNERAPATSVRAPLVPDLTSDAPLVEPYDGPIWKRAERGDPMDLTRLAHRYGSGELLRASKRGGVTGRIALAALPYAEDADGALLALCLWLRGSQGENRRALLQVIHEVLQRAPSTEEADPPRRDRLCSLVLTDMARDPDPSMTDLAASATTLLQARLGR